MKKQTLENIVTYLICAFAVAMAVFTAAQLLQVQDVDKETTPQNIFGYYGFVVLSGSMTDEFAPGDVIITKQVDASTIQVGDIISFISVDPNSLGVVVTHKVRSITQYEGALAFETYGTETGISDDYPAVATQVIGQYVYKIPKIGYAVMVIQGEYGFLLCIIFPIALLFVAQLIKLLRLIFSNDDDDDDNDDAGTEKDAEAVALVEAEAAADSETDSAPDQPEPKPAPSDEPQATPV